MYHFWIDPILQNKKMSLLYSCIYIYILIMSNKPETTWLIAFLLYYGFDSYFNLLYIVLFELAGKISTWVVKLYWKKVTCAPSFFSQFADIISEKTDNILLTLLSSDHFLPKPTKEISESRVRFRNSVASNEREKTRKRISFLFIITQKYRRFN